MTFANNFKPRRYFQISLSTFLFYVLTASFRLLTFPIPITTDLRLLEIPFLSTGSRLAAILLLLRYPAPTTQIQRHNRIQARRNKKTGGTKVLIRFIDSAVGEELRKETIKRASPYCPLSPLSRRSERCIRPNGTTLLINFAISQGELSIELLLRPSLTIKLFSLKNNDSPGN